MSVPRINSSFTGFSGKMQELFQRYGQLQPSFPVVSKSTPFETRWQNAYAFAMKGRQGLWSQMLQKMPA